MLRGLRRRATTFILGATGGTGLELVRQGLEQGHPLSAMKATGVKRLTVVWLAALFPWVMSPLWPLLRRTVLRHGANDGLKLESAGFLFSAATSRLAQQR